jgi:hypothetical protein
MTILAFWVSAKINDHIDSSFWHFIVFVFMMFTAGFITLAICVTFGLDLPGSDDGWRERGAGPYRW